MQISNKNISRQYMNFQYSNKSEQMKNIRILQRNSLHLVGLPAEIAQPNILKDKLFFGQYGNIKRISVRKVCPDKRNKRKGFLSVYVTFTSVSEASIAIICLNGLTINRKQIKVSYGLTRYCQSFLRGLKCQRKQCDYKHEIVDSNECCDSQNKNTKNQIKSMKNCEVFKFLMKHNFNFKQFFKKQNKNQSKPNLHVLPSKDIVQKKYQKFIQKFKKEQNLQNIKQRNKNLEVNCDFNFKKKQDEEQFYYVNQNDKFYSPQQSFQGFKKMKKFLSIQEQEDNDQEADFQLQQCQSSQNQTVSKKKHQKKNKNQKDQMDAKLIQPVISLSSYHQVQYNRKHSMPYINLGVAPYINGTEIDYQSQKYNESYLQHFVLQTHKQLLQKINNCNLIQY